MKPHPNVLQIFGVVTEPLAILTELMTRGSLDSILAKTEIDTLRVLGIAKDIACGMLHLHLEVSYPGMNVFIVIRI